MVLVSLSNSSILGCFLRVFGFVRVHLSSTRSHLLSKIYLWSAHSPVSANISVTFHILVVFVWTDPTVGPPIYSCYCIISVGTYDIGVREFYFINDSIF